MCDTSNLTKLCLSAGAVICGGCCVKCCIHHKIPTTSTTTTSTSTTTTPTSTTTTPTSTTTTSTSTTTLPCVMCDGFPISNLRVDVQMASSTAPFSFENVLSECLSCGTCTNIVTPFEPDPTPINETGEAFLSCGECSVSSWEFKIDAPASLFADFAGTNPFTVRLEIDEIEARIFIEGEMPLPSVSIDTFCLQGRVGLQFGPEDSIVFFIL